MNKSIYYAQWGKSENWKNTYLPSNTSMYYYKYAEICLYCKDL